jgi:hypothetical protein
MINYLSRVAGSIACKYPDVLVLFHAYLEYGERSLVFWGQVKEETTPQTFITVMTVGYYSGTQMESLSVF